MDELLLSIIVPIYKVEPYLRRCLDSLLSQTYRNLQIVLVDDGSPDQCGAICDEYARKDGRITVIHKPNGGVSSARNAGLDAARGEWIGWVDPDDWVDEDYFEYLLCGAVNHSVDVAICAHYDCVGERRSFRGLKDKRLLETDEAIDLLLQNDAVQSYLWDKIWKHSLFEGIRFPEGRTYEDVAVVHRLFSRANRILYLPEAKYYYLQRPGGIVGTTSLSNRIHYYLAAQQRMEELSKNYPQFQKLLEAQCVAAAVPIWSAWLSNDKSVRSKYRQQADEIAGFCREHKQIAIETLHFGRTGRAIIRLTPYPAGWAFFLAFLFGKIYQLVHGRTL